MLVISSVLCEFHRLLAQSSGQRMCHLLLSVLDDACV